MANEGQNGNMEQHKCLKKHSGFTLIEILMVTAILGTILTVIYSSFHGAIRTIRQAREESDIYQIGRVIMDKMVRDLSCVYYKNTENFIFKPVNNSGGYYEQDSLDFISASHRRSGKDVPESDLAEIGYYIDKYNEGLLIRREDIYLDDEPDKGGKLQIIGENVIGLNFLFPKEREEDEEQEWLEEWDMEKESQLLPKAVKIDLTIQDKSGEDYTFSTIVSLETGNK